MYGLKYQQNPLAVFYPAQGCLLLRFAYIIAFPGFYAPDA